MRVTKDHLVFSAGHFITIDLPSGQICERLHGHNWRVAVEVSGASGRESIRVRLHRAAGSPAEDRRSTRSSDVAAHAASGHPSRRRTARNRSSIPDRRWVFPSDECVLLPVSQTTAELIARWIGQTLDRDLEQAGWPRIPFFCDWRSKRTSASGRSGSDLNSPPPRFRELYIFRNNDSSTLANLTEMR